MDGDNDGERNLGDDDAHTGDGDDVSDGTAANEEEDVNVANLFVDTTDVHRSHTKVSEETFVEESTSSTPAAKDKNPLSAKAPDTNFGYSQPPTPTRWKILVWDPNYFTSTTSMDGEGFVAIVGNWIDLDVNCLLIVVYALQEQNRKEKLWQNLDICDGLFALVRA
nr:cytochrome P450 [Tanacetum cinerariifolium]